MKEESVLSVLVYLFKNHMHSNGELDTVQAKLLLKLEKLGFRRKIINRAFEWIDNLTKQPRQPVQPAEEHSLRVFADWECEWLNLECRSLLMTLEQQGILNPQTRELVINQALELDLTHIDVSLLKWITLMVLFNQPNEKQAFTCMEFLVLDNTLGGIQ